jgi:hypothetical protein
MQANGTLGFVPEPDGRGTMGILWSCLATLVICFWSSMHADFDDDGNHFDLVPRVIAAITYPDFLVSLSLWEYLQARSDTERINGIPQVIQSQATWTVMHAFYVNLGAFALEDGKSITMVELIGLIRLGCVSPEPPSLKEVKNRSKRSRFAKFLAVMQITWFALQVLARAIQHIPISLLEITTASYVVLTIAAYVFVWHKPANVLIPSVAPLLPSCKSTIEQIRTYLDQFKDDDKKRKVLISAPKKNRQRSTSESQVEPKVNLISSDIKNDNIDTEPSTLTKEPIASGDLESQQPLSTGDFRVNSPTTVPQDGLNSDSALMGDDALEIAAQLKSFLASDEKGEQFYHGHVFPFAGLVFSALHCLAWNFYFPSTPERWIWRVASICAGVSSFLILPLVYFDARFDIDSVVLDRLLSVGIFIKLTLLVETFVALRRMPVGVYETVHWTNFLPHV